MTEDMTTSNTESDILKFAEEKGVSLETKEMLANSEEFKNQPEAAQKLMIGHFLPEVNKSQIEIRCTLEHDLQFIKHVSVSNAIRFWEGEQSGKKRKRRYSGVGHKGGPDQLVELINACQVERYHFSPVA
jgi:hypothetical protein